MPEQSARLVFDDREVPITQDVITIGRSEGNDVTVTEVFVSSTHAEIQRTQDGFLLRDLGSKNGTYVNGREIRRPRLLNHGDEISLARVCDFKFSTDRTTALLPGRRGLHVDEKTRKVTVDGRDVNLSLLQYRLVHYLYGNSDRSCSRDEIIQYVWRGSGMGISDAAIDSLVNRVRERIASIDPDHEYIVTIRGYGFRFRNKV